MGCTVVSERKEVAVAAGEEGPPAGMQVEAARVGAATALGLVGREAARAAEVTEAESRADLMATVVVAAAAARAAVAAGREVVVAGREATRAAEAAELWAERWAELWAGRGLLARVRRAHRRADRGAARARKRRRPGGGGK